MGQHLNKKIEEELAKEYPYYVVITCQNPTEEGQMQVEMSYQGDAALAAYLLHGAQEFFEDLDEE